MNRNLTAFTRQVRLMAKRADHHHAPANPGPPITLDYMPIPKFSHKSVYDKLQKKFNLYLLISGTFFVCSVATALKCDVWHYDAWRATDSYRDRNKNK